ncbi:MAG TPA: alpha/beta fold hydrolase [Hyphomicrobiaceae bacterium]|nr:alpha/beta fold hydrolase [Hyphomicrobiaceae bacterium]
MTLVPVSRLFCARDFRLESGAVLPELTLAYETYGTLAPHGRNAVLATHGYTSSHHVAGRYGATGIAKGHREGDVGTWDRLIGPGKPIDTDRLFVVSSNMLGSSYGSTNPASINPATGKPYGPDFPHFTVGDIVRAQKAMLDGLGVTHLVAVAGPSYGGYQAFQWAVTYPQFVDGIVAAVSAPRHLRAPNSTQAMIDQLAEDPNWNGGWYYDNGGVARIMTRMRIATLKFYGIEAQLAAQYPDRAAREAAIVAAAELWAENFDANSMVALRRALETFDTTPQFDCIKAKVLYVISRTDQLFPPAIVPGVMQALKDAGVDARYFALDSDLGHLASGLDGDKWAPALRSFMAELTGA